MNHIASLIRILYRYFEKIERGITPTQAAGEAMKAMQVQFSCFIDSK